MFRNPNPPERESGADTPATGKGLGVSPGDIWERDLYGLAGRSARRAWAVAAGCGLLALVALAHSLFTLSQHRIEPVVITVDRQTGQFELPSRLGTVTLDDDEAITQSYIFRYVRDRETYDPADNIPRIEAVYAESEAQAAESLFDIWGNPKSDAHPFNIYGDDGTITVQIRSISFIDRDTASIRLRKTIRDGGGALTRDYVVTLDFAYARARERALEAVWRNPLGFQVTRYRIDAETFEGGES